MAVCLSSLPCDVHGLVYSYLSWKEKLNFISICKEFYLSSSRSYREMRLGLRESLKYARNESFRQRVCTLVLPYHVSLDLRWCRQINDNDLMRLSNVQALNLSWCCGITDAGLAHLGNLQEINLSNCDQITDQGLRHLGNVVSLNLSSCPGITPAGVALLEKSRSISYP
jgi:hypothetical protein